MERYWMFVAIVFVAIASIGAYQDHTESQRTATVTIVNGTTRTLHLVVIRVRSSGSFCKRSGNWSLSPGEATEVELPSPDLWTAKRGDKHELRAAVWLFDETRDWGPMWAVCNGRGLLIKAIE